MDRLERNALAPIHAAVCSSVMPHLHLYTSLPHHTQHTSTTTMLRHIGRELMQSQRLVTRRHALARTRSLHSSSGRHEQATHAAPPTPLCTPMPPGQRMNAASTKLRATLQLPDSKQSWVAQGGGFRTTGEWEDHSIGQTRAVM
jgi:hypothetical protein